MTPEDTAQEVEPMSERAAAEPSPVEAAPAAPAFQLRQAQAPVTWTLSAVIALVFVAELALGGSDQLWLLTRMGAMTPTALADGELWRLLSSSFLHGNVGHVGFALVILWSLGGFIERVLGSARLLILYVSAALMGGVAAMLFGGGAIMVGSSGALWGLMVGHVLLAYRPNGLIPPALAEAMKGPAKKNLILNVLVSFLPGVSLAAHAGGAVAGLALMGSGLLARGLQGSGRQPSGPLTRLVAGALGLLLAASLPIAMLDGEVPSLVGQPEVRTHALERVGLELELPALLGDAAPNAVGQPPVLGVESLVYGEFMEDPFVVEVFAVTGLINEQMLAQAAQEIEAGVTKSLQGQGWTRIATPPQTEAQRAAAREAAVAQGKAAPRAQLNFKAPNDVRLDVQLLEGEDALLRVDVVRWPGLGSPWDQLALDVPLKVRRVE